MPIEMTAVAVDYELVMLNGRGMDPETMCDDIVDVGVTHDGDAASANNAITGRGTTDATG